MWKRLWPEACTERSKPVPAVVGITVAEVERLQAAARERHWDELLAGTTAATKLNEARAEAANMAQAAETWRASYEAADKALIEARAEAARYREALERIATGHSGTAPDPLPLSRWEQRNLARAALRGGDGHG